MTIREMTIEDYDEVYKLWSCEKSVGLRSLDDSREGIERFLSRNPTTCFVAVRDERIVGTILCGSDGRRGYIYHAMVAPEQRRSGIGSRLVEEVTKALRSLGINKTALVVFAENRQGNIFWEKLGFTERDDLVYRNKSINDLNI